MCSMKCLKELSSVFMGKRLMLKGEIDCLVWVERMASMLDMKIVQVLVRSLIAIFVV